MNSKTLATHLKDILPHLTSSNQTSKNGRLIYDVLKQEVF